MLRNPLIAISVLIILGGTAGAERAAAADKPVVAYTITAELDTETWTIDCTETVTFLNKTGAATDVLLFHLYPNGFANNLSARQAGRTPSDFKALGEPNCGYMNIEKVVFTGEAAEAAAGATAVINDTLMSIPLSEPLKPGESITLSIDFSVKSPSRTISRSGFIGWHYHASQWYPKLAVLEEDGWNAPAFLPWAEFYGDFGTFDVSVTVPDTINVVATGSQKSVSLDDKGSAKTFSFHAENVHDFAWVADAFAQLPTPSTWEGVKIINMVQPYAGDKTDGINKTLKSLLGLYREWYMPYPYENIVTVGAPHRISAGMEYPGLIDISFRFPTHIGFLADRTLAPYGVTIHEFTHQYFYGIVANNEAESPWLDEGLTTYSTAKAVDEIFGPGESVPFLSGLERMILVKILNDGFGLYDGGFGVYDGGGDCAFPGGCPAELVNLVSFVGYDMSPFHGEGTRTLLGYELESLDIAPFNTNRSLWMKEEYAPAAGASAVVTPVADFYPGKVHPIAYSKAALSLLTLERHMGRETMKKVLKTYVERFRFNHPNDDDFLGVLVEIAGGEYKEMADRLFRGTGTIDFAVESATCREIAGAVGFLTQKAPGDPVSFSLGDPDAEGDPDAAPAPFTIYEWEVIVRNRGGVELPAEVELLFDDGSVTVKTFDGKKPFLRIRGEGPRMLLAATIDPEHKFPLDLNRINNSRTVRFQEKEVLFLSGAVHFWAQNFLNGWAFFN